LPAWLLLAIAILSEVLGTAYLKVSDGFTKFWPSVVVVVAYAISFVFLALTLRELSLGFTYAVWAGIGTALIAVVGVIAFGDTLTAVGVAGIALVIAGVALLNLSGAH
jgi:small multidrug resistance pump